MKQRQLIIVFFITLMIPLSFKAQSIAVFEFTAGAGIKQSDVEGISSTFNTCFSPTGYTMVERTQIKQAIKEQKFQRGDYTKEQIAHLGQVLGVTYIVVGDVTFPMKEYNVDVRVVNAESGEIVAKDGITCTEGSSYRETLCTLGKRLAELMPPPPEVDNPKPATEPIIDTTKPEPKNKLPRYRPSDGIIRFTMGHPVIALGYGKQLTSNLYFGAGAGYGFAAYSSVESDSPVPPTSYGWDTRMADHSLALYGEFELRTPRYAWSLFLNVKAGYLYIPHRRGPDHFSTLIWTHYIYRPFLYSATAGVTFYNVGIGVGYTNQNDFPLSFHLTYDLPMRKISKAFSRAFL